MMFNKNQIEYIISKFIWNFVLYPFMVILFLLFLIGLYFNFNPIENKTVTTQVIKETPLLDTLIRSITEVEAKTMFTELRKCKHVIYNDVNYYESDTYLMCVLFQPKPYILIKTKIDNKLVFKRGHNGENSLGSCNEQDYNNFYDWFNKNYWSNHYPRSILYDFQKNF